MVRILKDYKLEMELPAHFYSGPLVTDEGDVMIPARSYTRLLGSNQPTLEVGGFIRVDGIPPAIMATEMYNSLLILTMEGELITIDRDHPSGIILDLPPVRKLINYIGEVYMLEENDELSQLTRGRDTYTVSDSYVEDVMFFGIESTYRLVIIDRDNRLFVFDTGFLDNGPSIVSTLVDEVKELVTGTNDLIMIDVNNNVLRLENDTLLILGNIDHEFKYVAYIRDLIYTIDYDGILRVMDMDSSIKVIPGSYNKFCELNYRMIAVEDDDGRYGILDGSDVRFYELPFRLFSFQEFEAIRDRPMIKSARFTV